MTDTTAPYLLRYRERMARRDDADHDGRPPLSMRSLRAWPARGADAALAEPTRSPEIVAAPLDPDVGGAVELHLVRHGETQSYLADAGLTPRGTWQSRRLGLALAAEVRDGEAVRLLFAPTARAARTADQLRLGLEDGLAASGRRANVHGPEPAERFRNFQVWTPAGMLDPTGAAGEYRSTLNRQAVLRPGERPLWQLELNRYWVLQSSGADPIEFWLKNPLLAFEPPASVVRRFWAGAVELGAEAGRATRVVCCTHSGPMRAFATWALGHDAGEPFNTEQVRVRVWPERARVTVTYRGRTQDITGPPDLDAGTWWER
ncbi:MAG TPA: histidine phosphatase family protein [Terriglobales bacterium]|nr:histidine phosphatase family protein [Terriglobales bacterium]